MFNLGARIILACRDVEKAKETATQIVVETPTCQVVVHELDLSSLASVRKFANEILKSEPKIDILINNAGVACTPQWKSEDGYEMQFATNHLGHFLLTLLLLDRIKESAPARIINVSSIVHHCEYFHLHTHCRNKS